jgi:hypothetical protein
MWNPAIQWLKVGGVSWPSYSKTMDCDTIDQLSTGTVVIGPVNVALGTARQDLNSVTASSEASRVFSTTLLGAACDVGSVPLDYKE